MRTEEATGLVPRLAIFYAALFVLLGIQMPFFPVWLEAKGVDAGMIGIVLAAPIVARLLAVPVFMREADRRDAVRAALIVCGFAAAAGYTLVGARGAPLNGSMAQLVRNRSGDRAGWAYRPPDRTGGWI